MYVSEKWDLSRKIFSFTRHLQSTVALGSGVVVRLLLALGARRIKRRGPKRVVIFPNFHNRDDIENRQIRGQILTIISAFAHLAYHVTFNGCKVPAEIRLWFGAEIHCLYGVALKSVVVESISFIGIQRCEYLCVGMAAKFSGNPPLLHSLSPSIRS